MTRILALPVWQPIVNILDPIGPVLHGNKTDASAPVNSSWIVSLCLSSSIALFLVAIGHGAGRRGDPNIASVFFWSGLILLVFPIVSRISWSVLARAERLFLLVMLGEFLYIFKLLHSPSGFVAFDEMLHWMTAYDILNYHKLFMKNALLPISAYYPSLEILTTALANLTKLNLFPTATLVIATLRGIFIVTLFLFFEKISGSARLASVAVMIYMGCSTFALFDVVFAYESLGVVLCVMIMMLEARVGNSAISVRSLVLPIMLFGCLSVTHHVSAIWCALYLIGVMVIEALRRDKPHHLRMTAAMAGFAIAVPLLWMITPGNPFYGYIMPSIERALFTIYAKLAETQPFVTSHEMFVSSNGKVQPFINRFIGITSTLLLTVGLTTGFFRLLVLSTGTSSSLLQVLRLKWQESRLVLLAIGAFGFPVSVMFRLTGNSWEIGHRMNTFVFIPVGLVVAVSIIHYWQAKHIRWSKVLTGVVIADIVLGGIVIGSGIGLIRGFYLVAADELSIESMGIETVLWTKTWLGEGNVFAADRVNRTLLATYGQQEVFSNMTVKAEESRIFFDDRITSDTVYPLRKGNVDYVFVDLRLTTARSVVGEYYENGEGKFSNGNPPLSHNLLKFDQDPRISRVFDNGWIMIYDVRGLRQ